MPKTNLKGKNCINCGLQKPLSAFLEISGPQGSSYGNVCSTCRGSGASRKISIPDIFEEESGSSSTGLKIDHKTKVHMDLEQKKLAQKIKESHREELEKRTFLTDEKIERKDSKAQAERKHREDFLNYQSKKTADPGYIRAGQEKDAVTQKVIVEDKVIKEENATLEKRNTTEDFSNQTLDKHSATISRHNPGFEAWKKIVGGSAAFNTFNRQYTDNRFKPDKKPTVKDAVDFIQENFETQPSKTPPSRRR